jgi:diacylglycerol kinase family enzyme
VSVEVIVNRNAHHLGESSRVRRELLAAAGRRGARVHETWTLEELAEVTRAMAAGLPRAVVLAGGDGSYMEGLSALRRAFGDAMPPVALAPGGTVATIARNLGAGGATGPWCESVLAAVSADAPRTREAPTLHVTDDAGGDRVGFIFGAGLVARFFEVYDAAPRQGVGPAARIAARVLVGSVVGGKLAKQVLAPVAARLEIDGAPATGGAWSLVLASVLRDVGLRVRATYRAGEAAGTFHAVASALTARGLATQVPRVLTGRRMGGAGHVDMLARELCVRFDEPAGYILDGDAKRAGEVRVRGGPAVTIVVP